MWYQKDWFTGSDYYNFRERQISVQELCIINPVEQVFHERTEIYYVRSGKATIWGNGEKFKVRQGRFPPRSHRFRRLDSHPRSLPEMPVCAAFPFVSSCRALQQAH